MTLVLERYLDQVERWPRSGRHILAQYDADSIVVYQAYRPSIGRWAVEHGRLGGPAFSFSRMSWIKPNFLWMMYRSGWGTKEDQEITLALRIRRRFFESLFAEAVASSFDPRRHASKEAWSRAVAASNVRFQWDPDHDPSGAAVQRRAIQLGLRGEALAAMAEAELIEVIDVSPLVAAQRPHARAGARELLETPREEVYVPESAGAAAVAVDGLDGLDV